MQLNLKFGEDFNEADLEQVFVIDKACYSESMAGNRIRTDNRFYKEKLCRGSK